MGSVPRSGDKSVTIGAESRQEASGRGVGRGDAARSALWSMAENGGLTLVSFATLIVLARFLSPSDFGLFSIVLAAVELLSVCVGMLFHDALIQRDQITERHFDTAFTVTVVLGLALFGACWALGPWFSALVGDPVAGRVLGWTALALPFAGISATIAAQQRREFRFRVLAIRSLIGRVSGAALGMLMAFLGLGYWSLAGQHVLIAAIGSLVLWLAATRTPRFRFRKQEAADLLGFGLKSLAGLVLGFALKRVFTIVAGVSLGTSAAGYLNMSFRLVDVVWSVSAVAVTQVALPVLSRMQNQPERLRSAFGSASEMIGIVFFALFIGIAITAPELVELLLGQRWAPIAPYVTLLALLVFAQTPRTLIVPVLKATGWPGWALVGTAAQAIVIAALTAIFGISTVGSAVAIWMLGELIAWPVMAQSLKAKAGIGFVDQMRSLTTPALAAAAMMTAAFAVRHSLDGDLPALMRLVVIGGTGAMVFVSALALLDHRSIERLWSFFRSAAGERTT
ncbi:MAG: lipopolysaccharide biosynthesis protein [Burkholderiales bacterium]